MNKWLLLLIVAGLGVAGWLNRDQIEEFLKTKGYWNLQAKLAPATPNPALESVAMAKKTYPALGIANSPFNLRFVAHYNELKESDPNFLAQDNWPVLLAQRTADEMNATAMPPPAAPAPVATFQPSALDSKPLKPGSTVPPTVQLPGLQGSPLDQRPAKQPR